MEGGEMSRYEPSADDYVQHGFVALVGLACLVVLSPFWIPLYVVGRVAAQWFPVEDPTANYNSVDGYW